MFARKNLALLAALTLPIASCNKETPSGEGDPVSNSAKLIERTLDSKVISFKEVEVSREATANLVLCLVRLGSSDPYNELKAAEYGTSTFAIMRGGDPLKFEYPPRNFDKINPGDIVIRYSTQPGHEAELQQAVRSVASKKPGAMPLQESMRRAFDFYRDQKISELN